MSLAYALERVGRDWRSRVAAIVVISGVAVASLGDYQQRWSRQAIQELNDQVDELYTVANDYAHNGQLKDKFSKNSMVPVFFSCPFPAPHAIRFRAIRDGWDFLMTSTYSEDLNIWKDLATSAAMIVVPDDPASSKKIFEFLSNYLIPEAAHLVGV